jgi:hypothetical protein
MVEIPPISPIILAELRVWSRNFSFRKSFKNVFTFSLSCLYKLSEYYVLQQISQIALWSPMTYTVLWDPERAVKNTMGLNKEGNNKKHFYLVEKKNLLLNGHDLTEPICSYQDYNIKPV